MSGTMEGRVEIPLEEFWKWVEENWAVHDRSRADCVVWGVPRIVGSDLVIDFAAGTETEPQSWSQKPEAVKQWETPPPSVER